MSRLVLPVRETENDKFSRVDIKSTTTICTARPYPTVPRWITGMVLKIILATIFPFFFVSKIFQYSI